MGENNSSESTNKRCTLTMAHLQSLTNYCSKEDFSMQKLQTHYMHLYRIMSDLTGSRVKSISTSKVCAHCSAIWRPGSYTVHILPNKHLKQNEDKATKNMQQYRNNLNKRSLLQRKSLKDSNQIIKMKCFNCNKYSTVSLKKPKKKKPVKMEQTPIADIKKKKKKKPKDKFCNLNISANSSLNTSLLNNSFSNNTPKLTKVTTPVCKTKLNKKQSLKLTPVQKISQINKLKLENVLKENASKKRKSGLGSFLSELF